MILNVAVPNEFSALRVITLASDAACAHRLASALSGLGVLLLANVDSLDALQAWLDDYPVDVIVCEIRPECGDGLMLPSLL